MELLALRLSLANVISTVHGGSNEASWILAGQLLEEEQVTKDRIKDIFLTIGDFPIEERITLLHNEIAARNSVA